MQVHGIAVGGGLFPVFIGQGQHAVHIAVGAGVGDAVVVKEELVGAGGVEDDAGAAVVGDDLGAVDFFFRGSALGGSGFLLRFLLGAAPADNGLAAVIQGPDSLGYEVQHGGLVVGVIDAVGVAAVDLHLRRALHLGGVGVGLHLKDGVIGLVGGNGAVLVLHIAAFGHGGQHQTQAGIVADLGALAAFDHIAVDRELIAAAAVQIQRRVDVEAAVGADHAGKVGAEELVVGHVLRVLVALVEGDGVEAAGAGRAIGDDVAAGEDEGGLGHEVQHGGLVVGVIDAVGVVAIDLHLGRALHLGGIGVGLHLKDGVIGPGNGHGPVAVVGVGALGRGGQHKTQAGVVTDLGALAALDHIAVRVELIGAAAVQLQRHIDVEAAVGADHAGEVGAEKLEVGHVLRVLVALVEGDLVNAAGGRRRTGGAGSGGAAAQQPAHGEAGDQHSQKQEAADRIKPDRAALAARFAAVEAADDVENHGEQQQHHGAEGHVDGLFTAVTGVIVGEDAVADALHAVAQQQDRGGGQQRGDAVGQEFGPEGVGVFAAQEKGRDRHKDAGAEQGSDDARLHLAKDVIAGGIAQEEEQQRRQGQRGGHDAGAKLQRVFLIGHVHCLLSFRSAIR